MKLSKEQVIKITHRVWKEFNAVPHQYQLDTICNIVFNEHNRIIILKARAIGISFAISFGYFLKSIQHRGEYILVAQDKQNSEHILGYIQEFYKILKSSPAGFSHCLNIGKDYMRFDNGSQLYSKASEPKSLRGLHGDVYWDETAYTLNDGEMRDAINGCLKPDFQFTMSTTPCEQSGVFYDIWTKGKNWLKYELDWTKCPDEKYRKSVLEDKERSINEGWYDSFLQEYCCKFIDGATRLFTWDIIASHIEKQKVQIKTEYAGADFGKKIDQSIYHEIGKDKNGIIRVNHTHEFDFGADYSGQLDIMIERIKSNKDVNKFFVDSTGVGVKLLEDLQNSDIGYITKGITFTNAIKEKMVMYLYSLLLQDKILLPNDKKLTKQMYGIKRTKTDIGLNRYKHEDNGHDDSFWAFCLALLGYSESAECSEESVVSISGESKLKKHFKDAESRNPKWMW